MQKNDEESNVVIGNPRRAALDLWSVISDAELRGLLFFVGILLLIGTTFYTTVEGWGVVTSLYFSIATLTTVGYGDLYPSDDVSRMFTAVYVLVGVGFLLSAVMRVARLANRPVINRLNGTHKQKRAR
jgi:hypothetical protein